MTTKNILAILMVTIGFATCNVSFAQCKGWAKRNCLPTVTDGGFKFSGQMSNAVLTEGEKADLSLSFNSGKTYRIMVCAEELLGDVTFKLLDSDKTLLYDSEGKEERYFDFNVESTQELILEIIVPEGDNTHGMTHHGCVSIIQGYK